MRFKLFFYLTLLIFPCSCFIGFSYCFMFVSYVSFCLSLMFMFLFIGSIMFCFDFNDYFLLFLIMCCFMSLFLHVFFMAVPFPLMSSS